MAVDYLILGRLSMIHHQ